jgi:hypothetical protein
MATPSHNLPESSADCRDRDHFVDIFVNMWNIGSNNKLLCVESGVREAPRMNQRRLDVNGIDKERR